MSGWLGESESVIRLASFGGVFALMALLELVVPCRELTAIKPKRWVWNVMLTVLSTVIVRLVLPIGAVGLALYAKQHGWGLFNAFAVPGWVAVAASVVFFDFLIYLQHVMFHAVPALWRLHVVHHADVDIDVTTGARFHPIEILLSMLIKFAAVVALGAPAVSVLIFEVVLNATAMFNHSNIQLPGAFDRWLRWIVVTPDMHRVHHSIRPKETHSNFGFNLPWWDRLMGTYRDQPVDGHQGMTIGVSHLQEPRNQSLAWMLALPFRTAAGASLRAQPDAERADESTSESES